ncbi:unnamed protein product [Linum tenue]|uniref:Bifunctional inhibitor/plant lipid transfer protein/seed storage helical domain-containing protein n=1 Tax=Linum tenue TaxID=586396 RepID=A0AAV0IEB6_9ROSI|nr:unnamed protein product [Linum tenue]
MAAAAAASKIDSSPAAAVLLMITALATIGCANGQECAGDMQGVIVECARFVQKTGPVTNPSPQCCSALRTLDIPCLCSRVPPELTAIVDMNKVFHVASFCAIHLPAGTKCGAFAVPPAAA